MHMRHMLIVLGIIVAAILVGAGLYFYGPEELRETPTLEGNEASALSAEAAEDISFTVIAEGATAANVTARKNYAVFDEGEFERLWTMAYGENAPDMPAVDFDEQYVIAVFAGEKSTGGHAIKVEAITDENAVRNVAITLETPSSDCLVTDALTSPFQIIVVPFSDRELIRTDSEVEGTCR